MTGALIVIVLIIKSMSTFIFKDLLYYCWAHKCFFRFPKNQMRMQKWKARKLRKYFTSQYETLSGKEQRASNRTFPWISSTKLSTWNISRVSWKSVNQLHSSEGILQRKGNHHKNEVGDGRSYFTRTRLSGLQLNLDWSDVWQRKYIIEVIIGIYILNLCYIKN